MLCHELFLVCFRVSGFHIRVSNKIFHTVAKENKKCIIDNVPLLNRMGYPGLIGLRYDVNPKVSYSINHIIDIWVFWGVSWAGEKNILAEGWDTLFLYQKKKKCP